MIMKALPSDSHLLIISRVANGYVIEINDVASGMSTLPETKVATDLAGLTTVVQVWTQKFSAIVPTLGAIKPPSKGMGPAISYIDPFNHEVDEDGA